MGVITIKIDKKKILSFLMLGVGWLWHYIKKGLSFVWIRWRWYLYLFIFVGIGAFVALRFFPNSSYTPNIVTELAFTIITVFFLSKILGYIEQEKSKRKAYEVIGNIHHETFNNIALMYVDLVKFKTGYYPDHIRGMIIQEVYDVVQNVEKYILEETLISKNKEVTGPVSNLAFNRHENYHIALHLFQKKTKKSLDEYTTKYINIIPKDLAEKVIGLENALLNPALSVLRLNDDVPMPIIRLSYKVEIYQKAYKNVGEFIYDLNTYFREYEGFLRPFITEKGD